MKILLINIKYLGDLIVSTPGIRSLRKAYPNAEIVIIVRKEYEEVLANNPNIDRIITFNTELKGNRNLRNFVTGLDFIQNIRKEKFDVVIALHPGDRVAFWSWFSGARVRIAPRKQSFAFLFNKTVDIEEDSISYLNYYNRLISELDVKIDSNRAEFFISNTIQNWADEFLLTNGINRNEILICIHPGASETTKIWQRERFVELIKLLRHNEQIKLLLIEGPQDRKICDTIRNAFKDHPLLSFYSTNISKTAALIKQSRLFITHDTGTRHLAVALGTPVLALLPEDNQKAWDFYSEKDKHHNLKGKRFVASNYPEENSYLGGISVESVYNKIGSILNLW